MHRLLAFFTLLAALVVPACGAFQVTLSDGRSVSERDGKLYVDDVALDFKREVTVQGNTSNGVTLKLASAVGLIDVVGVPGSGYDLIVEIHTEFEDDGTVSFEGGRLGARSSQGGAVLVHSIRGRVPEGVSLEIEAGTGEVVLADFLGNTRIYVSSGTAVTRLTGLNIDRLDIDTGTGQMLLNQVQANKATIESGTGELLVTDAVFQELRCNSGTGDFRMRNCRLASASFGSGTGDVILVDSTVTQLETSLGTGTVIMKDSPE